MIQIAILIVVVSGCVRWVYYRAFEHGKSIAQEIAYQKGVAEGREQILQEDLKRLDLVGDELKKLDSIVQDMISE